MTLITVREATEKDLPQLVTLHRAYRKTSSQPLDRYFPEHILERVTGQLKEEDCITFVAEIEQKLVGTCYLTDTGHLSSIITAPYYTASSPYIIYHALTEFRIKKATQLQLPQVYVTVNEKNLFSNQLAQDLGFTPFTTEEGYQSPLWFKNLTTPVKVDTIVV